MVLVGKEEPPLGDHLGTVLAKIENSAPVIRGLSRGHFDMVKLQIIVERKTK